MQPTCIPRSCNDSKEYIGPVKIVLVDTPKEEYYRRLCYSGLITLAQMMIAATTIIMLLYSLAFRDNGICMPLHVMACTIGYQILMPCGILSTNPRTRATDAMRPKDARKEHLYLLVAAMIFILIGTLGVVVGCGFGSGSPHSIAGFAAGLFTIMSSLSAFVSCKKVPNAPFWHRSHLLYGTIAFVLSSYCFIVGCIKPEFKSWVPIPDMYGFMIAFCVYYTIVVIFMPVMTFMMEVC